MRVYRHRGARMCRELSRIALTIGLAAGWSAAAMAQEQAPPTPPAASESENQIVVTGSRVTRSTFETPNPVTVLDSEDIQALGLNNVAEVVSQLPSNSNFFAANNVGLGNFNVGAQLVNLRGLNPFFGTRTLTLIDTRRVVPTTTGGGVDISLVPSMLVGRVETVTGGASAVYGSDAIAGVVNIILDKDLEGIKAQADYTVTTHGDGDDFHVTGAYGTAFADDRGHFIVGAEFQDTSAIGNCSEERGWCAQNYAMFTNEDHATNGQPHYIIGPNASPAYTSSTGVLIPCLAFVGVCIYAPAVTGPAVQFTPDGTGTVPFDHGLYSSGAGIFGFRQGGDDLSVGAYDATTMRVAVQKLSTLARVEYEVGSSITASLEGSYARSEANNPVATGAIGPYAFDVGGGALVGYHIAPDNAFLPASVAATMGPGGAFIGRNMNNLQTAENDTNNETWRVVAALDGDLGGGWNWDAYYSHGVNKNDQHLYHNVVDPLLRFALDAVNTPGGIVCGIDVPGHINPNTGLPYTAADLELADASGPCTPLNLFGASKADQAAIDYAFRTLVEFSTQKQDVIALNARGDLFSGFGAGTVKLAGGVEWRTESGTVTHDLDNQPWYSGYTLSYGLDYGGKTEVMEGYAELNVPVFRDSPVGKYLEVDAAARLTHNKNTGTLGANDGLSASREFVTWKLSGIWDVTDWLRFRATRSRDVRAPQFRELFQTYATTVGGPFGSVSNPWPGGSPSDPVNIDSGGDVNLRPEKADTLTVGAVLAPEDLFSGFRFSADWYQIKIKDAIIGPPFGIGAQNIVTGCFQGNQTFCDLMEGEGTPDIIHIDNRAANLQGFTTRGVDFEAQYQTSLGTGSLLVRMLASYLYDQLFDTGLTNVATGEPLPPTNYAGQSGPTAAFGSFNTAPKWQGNAFVTFNQGPFTGTIQARYVGGGRYLTVTASGGAPIDPSDPGYDTADPNSINDNSVGDAIYFNLSGSYDITKEVQVFASLNNVFDRDPVIAPGGNGFPTNPVYFDTFGRSFRIGARVNF
ncbi:TonB-dependent receptor [Croceibacterium sp. LX-88]|uniref:TonB-dependent receptor n=1 Tax=Croceibacterium selenioxidans TaxID=2838833 RepID=A0ABS5W4T9_9SPHN|nr:TonB-dependent receptor [Croceibacterium selenioxidans]MBT2134770.1 TonB-dependent receptor [Croceibacterium selenioxidans]